MSIKKFQELVGWAYLPNNNFLVQLLDKNCKFADIFVTKIGLSGLFSHATSDLIKSLKLTKLGAYADLKYLPLPTKCPENLYSNPQNKKPPKGDFKWRRNRDSNPRYARTYDGFQDRSNQPLWHSSISIQLVYLLILHKTYSIVKSS